MLTRLASLCSLERQRAAPAYAVDVPRSEERMPAACAKCLQPASQVMALERRARTTLIPYCSRCRAEVARGATFHLAVVVAALLLAATWLLVLPRLLPTLSVWLYLGVVAAVAALPGAFALLVGPAARAPGGAAPGVWWLDAERVVCARREWAEELAALNRGRVEELAPQRPPRPWFALFVAPLLGAASAPAAYSFFFPAVLVLNLSADAATLFADGRALGVVESTSLESPHAGLRVRLAAGHRLLELKALSDGSSIAVYRAQLEVGEQYLYAPASDGFCFWLEADDYGRDAAEARRVPLSTDSEFWRLPARIDSWFAANPRPSGDARSSGGTMLALRHAPCERQAR